MPSLGRITIYPIKSLDGMELQSCEVLPSGALAGDRRYALVDAIGRFVNGKRYAEIHRIRATYDSTMTTVKLSAGEREAVFSLAADPQAIANWCGEVLGVECQLIENVATGFPDDEDSPGPTLVTTSSLQRVGYWFKGLDLSELRRRFRFNFEIPDEVAYWEDELVPEKNHVRRFRVGDTIWQGRGICQRCTVPTRDSRDGRTFAGFAREFARQREADLPPWSPADRFDHYYRLGVNTALDAMGEGNRVSVGDIVELLQDDN